jgi:AraC-like DNA-binding protein
VFSETEAKYRKQDDTRTAHCKRSQGAVRASSSAAPATRDSHVNSGQNISAAASTYREFPPLPALAEFFVCFWTQTISPSSAFTQRVLPDCCVDIVLTNGLPMVVGPWTEPFDAHLPSGTTILGARCHPGLASGLLGMPASELLNRSVVLPDLWDSTASAQFLQVADKTTLSAQIQAMEAVLIRHMAHARPVDTTVRAAIRWMARHPRGQVDQLSKWLGISSRQLQRRFAISAGYGPRMFQSVLRFQRLLNEARRTGAPRSLAHLAAHAGYSDQAHMTREVRRFASGSPVSVLRLVSSTLAMSDLFKTGDSCMNYR